MYGTFLESFEYKKVLISVSHESAATERFHVATDGASVTVDTKEPVVRTDSTPFASHRMLVRDGSYWLSRMAEGVSINVAMGRLYNVEQLKSAAVLFDFASQFAKAIDAAHEPIVEEHRKRQEAEREERERLRQERQAEYDRLAAERREQQEAEQQRRLALIEEQEAALAPRKDQLMNEFVDDEVKVGIHGYKSVVRGWVRVGETVAGSFYPYIEFRYDNDRGRPNRVENIKRLEVKDGSRFKLVWDDEDRRGISTTVKRQVEDYNG